jgi:hypothetical protein
MTDKEIMQQALDALRGLFGDSGGVAVWRLGGSYEVKEAIDALKARLEQPEDVTEINFGNIADEPVSLKPCRSPYCECDSGKCTHPGFYDARDKPQPAAWVGLAPADYDSMRPRVPYIVNDFTFADVAAIVEAKLKEKNK